MKLNKVLWKSVSGLTVLASWMQVYLCAIDGKRGLDWSTNLLSKSPWAIL